MRSSIYFPVKPHIKKYLENRIGKKFIYSNTSIISHCVRIAISEKPLRVIDNPFPYDYEYEVEISPFYISKFNVSYNSKSIYIFNGQVELIFRDELYRFMDLNKTVYNIPYRQTLRDLFKKFNITEEDIKLESVLRDFTRKHEDESLKSA